MGRLCCSTDGNLNEEKFSEPTSPCHGLVYAAAASLTCAVVMACDALHGFGKHKLWYPCKYFSLNATSLTIIAVAIKYSLDLNTVMPHKQDRLTKLSSAVFMCTVMGNTMPSLGAMETKELLMNIIALGILVSTMIVNILFQLGTGIIFVFWKEYAFIMFIMLVLLVIYFSALTVPINKQYLLLKHNKKYEMALKEGSTEAETPVLKKLKEDLMKHWDLGDDSNQRSLVCDGAFSYGHFLRRIMSSEHHDFCRNHAGILFDAQSFKFCISQTIAVGVGIIALSHRWFTTI